MYTAPHAQEVPPAELPLRWLESYGDSLYAYALRRVRRPEVAEDLVQETLLAAVKAWDRFKHGSNVRTWLGGILRNKIADHLRLRYREAAVESQSLEDDACFDRHGKWKVAGSRWHGDPTQLAELREFRAVLDSCVSKLPTPMAHLFLSRVSDGLGTRELCDELGISPENAWTLAHRARLRLRQCLTLNWFSGRGAAGSGRSL